MAGMTLWGSKSRLENMKAQMERIWQEMDQALGGMLPVPADELFGQDSHLPPVEIFTKGGQVSVKVELPGFKQDDLTVTVDERQVTVSGERKREEELDKDGYHHSERYYGKVYRAIALPNAIDVNQAKATFVNGLLSVSAPIIEVKAPTGKKLELTQG